VHLYQTATTAAPIASPDGRIDSPGDLHQTVGHSIVLDHTVIGDIAADPAGSALVLTHCGADAVSVCDPANPAAARVIAVAGEPLAAVIAAGFAFIATTSATCDAVVMIDLDTATVVSTHRLAFNVTGIAVTADGRQVFAARTGRHGNDVAVLDVATGEVTSIEVDTDPGVIIDVIRVGPGGLLLAGLSGARCGGLLIVDADPAQVVATVQIGAPVRDVALSPDGAAAFVLGCHPLGAGAVIGIDVATGTINAVVRVGESATALALSPDGARAYVVEHDGVAVLCAVTGENIGHITVGARPSCVAVSAATCQLYVGDYAGLLTGFSLAARTATVKRWGASTNAKSGIGQHRSAPPKHEESIEAERGDCLQQRRTTDRPKPRRAVR
jgi:DNA-binding beta-propeller fold protein YncE